MSLAQEVEFPWLHPEVAVMPFPKGGIVVDVLGVGGDEGVRRCHYTPQGVRSQLIPLRWAEVAGHRCHDPQFIQDTVASSVALADEDGIYTGGLPGAAIFFVDEDGQLHGPILDYLELKKHKDEMMEWLASVKPLDEIYELVGGANVKDAFFQPWCIAKFLADRGLVDFTKVVRCGTLADYWTMAALGSPLGELRADEVMAQSQGIGTMSATAELFKCLDLSWLDSAINKVGFFPGGVQKLEGRDWAMPFSHDSYFARVMAFLYVRMMGHDLRYGVWTGGWSGIMRLLSPEEVQPNEATFRAGLVFEGSAEQMFLITNAVLLGGLYKELVQLGVAKGVLTAGTEYQSASQLATERLEGAELVPLDGFVPKLDAKELLAGYDGDFARALASTIWTHAQLCAQGLEAAADVLGDTPPEMVTMSGGWGLNEAALQAFRMLGVEPRTSPFVDTTTHDGAAVLAYLHWMQVTQQAIPDLNAARKIYSIRSRTV